MKPTQYIPIVMVLLMPLCALAENVRDAWYIGFGVGSGPASITTDGTTRTYSEFMKQVTDDPGSRLGLNFTVGGTLNRHFLLGFEAAAINQQAEVGTSLLQLGHTQVLLAGTWFPQGEGAFMKAGLGQARVTLRQDTAFGSREASEEGLGVMAGAGYAFWLGQSANLVLGADFHWAELDGDSSEAPTESQFTLIYIGCSWY